MKTKLQVLQEVRAELIRFSEKIEMAIEEQSRETNYSSRHYASAKRSAIDLKHELTKLTQDSKYRWQA